MSRSASLPLIVAFLWLLLLGGYLLTVPLALPGVTIGRIDIALIFSEWWSDYWGIDGTSLDQFIWERIDLWFTALLGTLGIWTSGRLVLRNVRGFLGSGELNELDFNLFAYGIGLSLVTSLVLILGMVGMLSSWLWRLLILVPLLIETVHWYRHRTNRSKGPTLLPFRSHLGLVLCAIPFLTLMILGATQPPLDFDVREYHLQGPKEYYLAGQITFLEHNVYTSFPALTEMTALLGMLLRGDWYRGALVGKCLLMPLVPCTGLALASIARKLFNETSGWLTCLIWLSIPWSYTLSKTAYAEGGMLFYLSLTFLLGVQLQQCMRSENKTDTPTDLLIPATLLGGFAGGAMACKYPGLIWGVLPAAIFLIYLLYHPYLRARSSSSPSLWQIYRNPLIGFFIGLTVAVGPWLFKNIIFTGNPVFPLAYGLFGGRGWTDEIHAAWQAGHSVPQEALNELPRSLFHRLVSDPLQSPLLLLFAPLLWLNARRRVTGWWLLGGIIYLTLMWWFFTHRIDRFWLPALLPFTVLAGGGFTWSDTPAWFRYSRVVGFLMMGVNFVLMISSLGTHLPVGSDMATTRQIAEQGAYLTYVLNQKLPAESRVLLIGEAQVFDARFVPIYNTVFNRSEYLSLVEQPDANPDTSELKPTAEIKSRFAEANLDYVAVNWEEILRYRQTYGFDEKVTPAHLQQLVEREILSKPESLWIIEFDNLNASQQNEIKEWAPDLIHTKEGKTFVVMAELYQVR
ncbi:hypothetical protein Pla110_04010 [Polystyrenella longa]|uniref:Glycosyltransferase RgtA/B/C/D-like domain-containing protein n=1 Tax=Polystyrenella longa TaxID=2528007 RepID=A0A518CHJ8_9PLAN|nr:hypothetical protein [Polystyrenella longa]QDU78697.1 hypothetical protein Pla110_04010 [Polystyrenella longa]